MLKISLIFMLVGLVFADVAPDPGYTNVPADLALEAEKDLSGYRFFLVSPIDFEEILIDPVAPTVVSASGRGGAARYANLVAVPISEIGRTQPDERDRGLFQKKFLGRDAILSHNFQATVSIVEKPVWKPPVYRLSIENNVVTATKVGGGSSSGSLLIYAIPVAFAGVLIAIGIAIIGIWLFRRSRKKV